MYLFHPLSLPNYVLNLLEDFYEEIGFVEKEHDSLEIVYNRFEIYKRACKFGLRGCIADAVQQFQTWKNSPNPDKRNSISENLRQIVYCTAISVGGQEEWVFVWERYLNANVENERETLLMALGCSKEIWILARYLDWAFSDSSGIRKHDAARVFTAVANNVIGQELAYKFLKTNWKRIRTYLGASSMALSSMVKTCTVKFNTQMELDDFKLFLDTKKDEFGIALRSALQAVEQGEANVRWMARYSEIIVKWLTDVNISKTPI